MPFPLFLIDSHPVDVCRTLHAKRHPKTRLGGLARNGKCPALRRWYHGVREHLVFTPDGLIAAVVQVPGNRHDIHGLYALMKTQFGGTLLADNGYWTDEDDRRWMFDADLKVAAMPKSNQHAKYLPITGAVLRGTRGRVERRIGLYDRQFHADRTANRSSKHYVARRLAKAAAHDASRHVSTTKNLPPDSVAHFPLCA